MKKDAYYFSHDSNARHDPKIGAVRSNYGWAGYGLYWAVIEVLRDQPDYSYPNGLLYGLALAVGFDPNDPQFDDVKFDDFIKFLVSVGLLKIEYDKLFSPSLINRMIALNESRAKLSEAGKRGAETRWGGHKGANATPMAVKESKGKKSKLTYGPSALEFLEYFNLKTGKKLGMDGDRHAIITARLETHTLEQLKVAVDNFIKDTWADRSKYVDIVYCIGKQKGKPDNLERWLNFKPTEAWVKP